MEPVCDLANKQPCEGGTPALSQPEINRFLSELTGWQQQDQFISKTYPFKNYYQTIAFVNALAWMTHQADHHPDLIVTYNSCRVNYSTHAIGGLSENDFICAAKADALFKL
ncbi:MAG: 4a-hydroxytetrahydrobiopterin dehydratase [Gallionella sp.]|nr:4a-hydroxytetrahydrobiopterin dehydratase [Gallionella sp.]